MFLIAKVQPFPDTEAKSTYKKCQIAEDEHSQLHLPLKEVSPHRVEEERRHGSIAIAAELLAVLNNLEEKAHTTLEPAGRPCKVNLSYCKKPSLFFTMSIQD